MNSIGSRLKDERKRLGLNQEEMAVVCGVQRTAQSNYERDERLPDAAYLAAVANHGVDISFVVTGSPAQLVTIELAVYADAWEVLDDVLQQRGLTLPAHKKRQAVDALYAEYKASGTDIKSMAVAVARSA